MVKLGFRIVGFFWMVSPVGFLIGRALGVWDFKYDIAVFGGLMLMSGISLFLNYNPDEN